MLFRNVLSWLTGVSASSLQFWWLFYGGGGFMFATVPQCFLWCFRGFKRDVLKAGLGVFCSPPFSSLTGTRRFGPQGRGLGEAEVGKPPRLNQTLMLFLIWRVFLEHWTELVGSIYLFLFSFPSSSSLSVCVCSFRWTWASAVVYYCWSYRYTAC